MQSKLFLLSLFISYVPCSIATISQSDLKKSIITAVSKYEATRANEWAFQVSRYENEEGDETSSVESYTPNLEQSKRWKLLVIDNREPLLEEQNDFQQRKQNADADITLRLRELIQTDSLEMLSEDQTHIRASFDVFLDRLGADASEHLQGTLTFAKQGEFIEQIEITNTDSLSPMFAATIDALTLTFTFVKIDQAILTSRMDLKMQGSFALFSEIDETSSDIYLNYQYIGPCMAKC